MARNVSTALRQAIGQRLRELREAAGVSSQEALAHRAGVHRTYVGRLERGESGVTVDSLAAILAALGLNLAAFFRPFTDVVRPRTPRPKATSTSASVPKRR
jgi:transcriptional regulator with XRE-family HTH domain